MPLALVAMVCGSLLGGCWIPTMAGMMAESYKRTSTRPVEAEYVGIDGLTFAVIIAADRVIQTNAPDLVPQMTNSITERLRLQSGATGYVPGPVVLQFQYANPGWAAMTYSELAQQFGVDRLVYVDLYEHRLYETGNSYLWDGQMAGTVGVIEADGAFADDFAFSRDIAVRFPDGTGFSPKDYSALQVDTVLRTRFLDRVTWPFYLHDEPYYPDY
ncbi:MAG: hypothetical protein ACYTF7_09245 [Planctomycetota bacterium]|jgi:hypothetical protein